MSTHISQLTRRLRAALGPSALALLAIALTACADGVAPTQPTRLTPIQLAGSIGTADVDPADTDGDGVANEADNCPEVANPDQMDTDGDGQGDACDTDDDNDGVADANDNCPVTANPAQEEFDGDGQGDVCDDDDDSDGIDDSNDNCPLTVNIDQADSDNDGIGDACESPPTIEEVIQELRDAVQALADAGVLNPGQTRKLLASVDDLVNVLATSPPELSIRALQSFIAGVNSLVQLGRLTPQQGASLTDPATDLITILGG
jgi:hypothetical protein